MGLIPACLSGEALANTLDYQSAKVLQPWWGQGGSTTSMSLALFWKARLREVSKVA